MPDKKVDVDRNPELDEEDEDEEGLSSVFGKLMAKKLKGSKKHFAEVD